MKHEVRAGMVAFGEPLIASGFSADIRNDQDTYRDRLGFPAKLSTLASRPDLIIRPVIDEGGNFRQESEGVQVDLLTKELLFLDELGLKTPGVSQAREPFARVEGVDTVIYHVVNRVEGYDFGADLNAIPESVATSAYEAILNYYRASLNESEEQRFWDLALRQLKYGTVGSESRPQTYLVDVDQYMRGTSPSLSIRNVIQAARDISKLEKAYDKEFPLLRERGAVLIEHTLEYATQEEASVSISQLVQLHSCLEGYLPYISEDTLKHLSNMLPSVR